MMTSIAGLLLVLLGPPAPIRFVTAPTKTPGIVTKSFDGYFICGTDEADDATHVSASYPQLQGNSSDELRLNLLLEQNVLAAVGIGGECKEVDSRPSGEAQTSSMDEECEITKKTPRFLSISCHASWEGGAHPDAGARAINIDRRSVQILEARTLFRDGSQGDLKQVLRKHLANLGENGLADLPDPTIDDILNAMMQTVWFTKKGASFEYYWRPNIFVADVPYKEISPLLKSNVLHALK